MSTQQSRDSAELDRLHNRIGELEGQLQESNAKPKSAYTLSPQPPPDKNQSKKTIEKFDDDSLLGSLLYHLDDGVIVVNTEGELILFNAAARRLIGIGSVPGEDSWATRYECFRSDRVTSFPQADLPLSRALRGETVLMDNQLVVLIQALGTFASISV